MFRPLFLMSALGMLSPCALFSSEEPVHVEDRPAGETCSSSADCGQDRACVESRCQTLETSIAGELLAAAGRELYLAGDMRGAIDAYNESFISFERKGLIAPPDILCEAAETAIAAGDAEIPRDQAARLVHECALASLPFSKARTAALEALSRLRHDGLSLERLDRDAPADAYFTNRPARPSPETVAVSISINDSKDQGYSDVRERLEGGPLRVAAVDCFLQAWELTQARAAEAVIEVNFRSRLRDMGSYDIYEGTPTVAEQPGEGFGPCVARVVEANLGDSVRVRRTLSWTMPIHVSASIQ